MGEAAESARSEVLAARGALVEELVTLEASARAAGDIPAKIRRSPAKAVGLAAGATFLLAGGPKRVFRRARRVVRGPDAELPKSMLPKEVDKTLRKLGTDGDRVRGTLEREFKGYLEKHAEERRSRDLGATVAMLLSSAGAPVIRRAGRQLAEQLFSPEGPDFQAALEKISRRRAEAAGPAPEQGGPHDRPGPAA
jgi:hypothetical protein